VAARCGSNVGGTEGGSAAKWDIVLESTPKGAAGAFYQQWQRAEETGSVRHFFPWWYEDSYVRTACREQSLTEEEREIQQRHELSLEQIAFRRHLLREYRGLAKQEFAEDPETCFLVSGECFFDIGVVQERLREVSNFEFQEIAKAEGTQTSGAEARSSCAFNAALKRCSTLGQPDEAQTGVSVPPGPSSAMETGISLPVVSSSVSPLWRFYPPVRGREYVIAVDAAGGGADGDYACAQVLDQKTGLQCAELRGHFSPRELAQKVAALGREYNGGLLVVERNNHGHEVLAYLKHEIRYERLYAERGVAGWLTGVGNRGPMLAEMEAWFAMSPERVNSQRLLEEMKTFVRKENGRAEAANGAHDDTVMAFAIALAARGKVHHGDTEARRSERPADS
jgi:hypothetical protein